LFEWSSTFLNSEKYEIIRKKEIKFLDEKIVIKSNVFNFCETNNSSLSSLNKSCVEIVEIEKEEEKRKSRFCFEFFVIDFVLNDFHVDWIKNLWDVVSIIEKNREYQKDKIKRKKEERMSFEIFNQYRENRSISNENDANLIQKVSAKRKLSKSASHEREIAHIAKGVAQIRSAMTMSSF
jgi:hypothetical protein